MPSPNKPAKNNSSVDSASSLLGRAYYLHLGLLERILKEEGLSKKLRPGMCNVLLALLAEDGQTISSIASRIRVAKSTMTGTVERLKTSGLVKVKVDSKDRRAQRVLLTTKSKALEPALQVALDQLESRVTQKMSKSDQTELCRLLNLAIDTMELDCK